jgi:hypothetical protein
VVTVARIALGIAQATYFALVVMRLGWDTRTVRQLLAVPVASAAVYSLVLCADAVWGAASQAGGT